jgi:hypothetical protein
MSQADRIKELQLEVGRREAALAEARKVFDRSNPETREVRHVRKAADLLDIAQGHLRRAWDFTREEARSAAAEEARQARRAPPDLQALVIAHGTYDQITPEAWAKFDADMAEWKAKIREGKFDAKTW